MSADRHERPIAGLAASTLLALIVVNAATARPIHYGAVTDTALLACDQDYWRGRVEEATICYETIVVSSADPEIRAEAAWALGDLHEANSLFQAALRDKPGEPAILVRWGDLYAETHQDGEAINIYREALATDSQHPFALLGAARLLIGGFDDAANTYLEPLLQNSTLAPGARASAWLMMARLALENDNSSDATRHLDTAAELLAANDLPPLELYALRAAADLVAGVTDSEWTERSLEYNPGFGDVFAIPAYFRVITRRYRDAIDLYQRAVDVDPGLSAAHEELGVNLLRDNQMARARRHLEAAHDLDPFSPVAVNTLRLLDSFDNFVVIEDPATPAGDGKVPILLRLHKDEAAAIAPYALKMTRDSIEEFTGRYGFQLREPVVIEMYPDHEDFAVRTAGMPGIGILGATFGYVVAMDSPSARPTDQFQWGTTLWHELAHVFTLEATDHLVPRWFSEGVSVYEEWRSGPTPGVRIPMSVYAAMAADQFLPLASLDQGFIRPSYPDQVIVSYMQAGLVCQFIDQNFGDDKLAEILTLYRDGQTSESAIQEALGIDVDEFDRRFADFVDEEHGSLLAVLDRWHTSMAALATALTAKNWTETVATAQEAIELHPTYVEADSPYLALARALEELGDKEAASDALSTFHERGGFSPGALKQLATYHADAGRHAAAIAALETAVLVQPLDNDLHATLGSMYQEVGDARAALREFEIVLAGNPHDRGDRLFSRC